MACITLFFFAHQPDRLRQHEPGRLARQLAPSELHAHYWEQLTRGGGFRALEQLRGEGSVGAIGVGVNEWEVIVDAIDVCDLDCALLAGRSHATFEDIRALANPVLRHRILLNYRAEAEGVTIEKLISDVVEKVPGGPRKA